MEKKNIYKNGKEKYNIFYIFFENLFLISLIAFGTYSIKDVEYNNLPILSIIYLSFIIFMHVFFLRKHMCTTCFYYGKKCHIGWGKLACVFKEESGNHEIGGIFSAITWIFIILFPFLIMCFQFWHSLKLLKIVYIAPYVFLMAINSIFHRRDCKRCKMRNICHGSSIRYK